MKRLRVIGTGIKGINHLTMESISHFQTCKKTLLYFPQQELIAYFRENNLFNEDITYLYKHGGVDKNNYEEIVNRVLSEVADYHDVSFCLPGHPGFGVSLLKTLKTRCKEQAINLSVSIGVSSFDTMVDDLSLDPIEHGSVIVDANLLVLLDYNMETRLNHFIYHICSVGTTRTHINNPQQDNKLIFLQQKLLKHYPENHLVKMISSAEYGRPVATIKECSIGKLEELLPQITFSSSLIVPYIKPEAHQINRHFLTYLQSSTVI